jgi:hypothetical protein
MKDEDETMKTNSKTGLKVNSGVRAGGFSSGGAQHSRRFLKIRTAIRAGLGDMQANHNRTQLACS